VIHQLSAAEERAGTADAKLFAVLADVLGRSDSASAIVFANRKTDCDELAARIRLHSVLWTSTSIHGDRTQVGRIATPSRSFISLSLSLSLSEDKTHPPYLPMIQQSKL
jgi:superfamily II DNA/RNA helicase